MTSQETSDHLLLDRVPHKKKEKKENKATLHQSFHQNSNKISHTPKICYIILIFGMDDSIRQEY